MNQVEKTGLIRPIKQLEQGLRDERPNRFAVFLLYTLAICWLAGLALHRSSGTEKLPEYFVIMGVMLSLFLVASHVLTITNFKNLQETKHALEVLQTGLEYQEVRCILQDSLLSITWQSAPKDTVILMVNQLINQLGSTTGSIESNVLHHYLQDLPKPIQELVQVRCREIHHQAAQEILGVTTHEIQTNELACTTRIKTSVKTMDEMRMILGLIPNALPDLNAMGQP